MNDKITPTPLADAADIAERDERAAFDEWLAEQFAKQPISVTPWSAWQARAALATTEATDAIAPTEDEALISQLLYAEIGSDNKHDKALLRQAAERLTALSTPSPKPAVDALTTGAVEGDGLCTDKLCRFAWVGPHGHSLPIAKVIGAAHPASEPKATDWRDVCAALIDIYDDAMNNAPEDRCYVDGAWKEELDKARSLLADRGSEGGK